MGILLAPEVKAQRARAIADLKNACRRHGVTHVAIASAANVTQPLVTNVLAGRNTSQNVVVAAQRLIAAAEARLKAARGRKRAADGDGA